MSQILIESFPKGKRDRPPNNDYLEVSEFFSDTIQGEGINLGHPAAFLRMKGCTLNCVWCDTKEVWREGNPYTFYELYNLMYDHGLVEKLRSGHHLVLTGGSPLRQQTSLILFLEGFTKEFGFKPYIEIENECTLMPAPEMIALVDCWNNSPKLTSSGNSFKARYNTLILGTLGALNNSWFKFVIQGEEDWEEILENYIQPGFITKDRIIFMPEGMTTEAIAEHREMVINMAIRHSVRYCSREHIVVWNRKTGV